MTFYAGEGAHANVTRTVTFEINDDNNLESDEVLVVLASLPINDSTPLGLFKTNQVVGSRNATVDITILNDDGQLTDY